jgi:biotin carboxylase
MHQKKIMILGASFLQLPAIQQAKKMGLQVIAVDMDPQAVGFQEEGVITEVISTIDTENVLKAARKHNIDGITTICTDLPMRTVATVAKELGLPGITPEAAFKATDKAAMRRCLAEHGVPVPQFYAVNSREEYQAAVGHFSEKCVVKAVDNSGSRGIQLLRNVRDAKAVAEAYEYCRSFSHSGELVVEEYMEGPEICVETLSVGGVCYPIQITDQLAKQPPYFTDAGYNQPSLLDEQTQEKIRAVAIAANMALENFTGSSCTEMIVTKDGPKVVEVGARLAGDCMTTHLVPLSTGVNMVEAVIHIALGEPVDIESKWKKGSCIRYYMKPTVGVIRDIRGLEQARQVPGIQDVVMLKGIGDVATELRSSGDRLGFVIAQCETPEEAIARCEEALNKIEVLV